MFLLFRLWARVLSNFGTSHSFVVAFCVKDLDLEVESLEKSLYVNSPLGIRVRIDLICRDCNLEILGILLIVDLQVLDMSSLMLSLGWIG